MQFTPDIIDLPALMLALSIALFILLCMSVFRRWRDEKLIAKYTDRAGRGSAGVDKYRKIIVRYYEKQFHQVIRVAGYPYNSDYLYIKQQAEEIRLESSKPNSFPTETVRNHETDKNIFSIFENTHGFKQLLDTEMIPAISGRSLLEGAAGSGKTTACKHMAFRWATEGLWHDRFDLVIFIALKEWRQGLSLAGAVMEKYFYDERSITENDISSLVDNAKILFVFDGLDEVGQTQRSHIEKEIDRCGPKNYLVTSRPGSLDKLTRFSYLHCYVLQPFSIKSIEEYLKKLCRLSNCPDQSASLLLFLEKNHNILEMARTPLLLDLLCTVWMSDKSIVRIAAEMTKTRLFEMVVELILERHLVKNGTVPDEMGLEKFYRFRSELFKALGRLAYEARLTSTPVLGRHLIYSILEKEKPGISFNDLTTSGFLDEGISRGSVLTAEMDLLFHHQCFQEYFVGYFISNHLTADELAAFTYQYKLRTDYKNIFIFTAGLLMEKNSGPFFKSLLNEPIDLSGFYQSFLAVSCLNESRCPDIIEDHDAIIESFRLWIQFGFEKSRQNPVVLRRSLEFIKTSGLVYYEIVADFLRAMQNENDAPLRLLSVEIMGRIGRPDNAIIDALLYRAKNDGDLTIRNAAVLVLGLVGNNNIRLIGELEGMLLSRLPETRVSSALSLLALKHNHHRVTNTLLEAMHGDNSKIRKVAATALGRLASEDAVIDALFAALEDENDLVRRKASISLGYIAGYIAGHPENSSKEVVNQLLYCLENETCLVRQFAAMALGYSGVIRGNVEKNVGKKVIAALIEKLDDRELLVGKAAASALGRLGKLNIMVSVALINRLSASDSTISGSPGNSNCAETVPWIESIKRILFSRLPRVSRQGKMMIIEAVGLIGRPDKPVIDLLATLLDNDTDTAVRSYAARALGMIKEPDRNIIELLGKYENDPDEAVRSAVESGLKNLMTDSCMAFPGVENSITISDLETVELLPMTAIVDLCSSTNSSAYNKKVLELVFWKSVAAPLTVYRRDTCLFASSEQEEFLTSDLNRVADIETCLQKMRPV